MAETATRTHITQVVTVVVPVSDQDRAIEFYVGTLGFEQRADFRYAHGERWAIRAGDPVVHWGGATLAGVPPMFRLRDPDGNSFLIVQRS